MLIVEMSHPYLSLSHLAKAMAAAICRERTSEGGLPFSPEESSKQEQRMEARLRALAISGAVDGHDWESLTRKAWSSLDIEQDVFLLKDLNACAPLNEEGFSFALVVDPRAELESNSDVVELVLNGTLLNWEYWVKKMRRLSAGQAARLMAGLDPDLYANLDARPVPKNDVRDACQRVVSVERLALNLEKEQDTAVGWLEWAKQHGFQIHTNFVLKVLDGAEEASAGAELLERSPLAAGDSRQKGEWALKEPRRYQGYSRPLYLVLKEAHSALQPKPRARDVLEAFKLKQPSEVIQVSHDGFTFYDSNGNAKAVDLSALGEAIRRMTS